MLAEQPLQVPLRGRVLDPNVDDVRVESGQRASVERERGGANEHGPAGLHPEAVACGGQCGRQDLFQFSKTAVPHHPFEPFEGRLSHPRSWLELFDPADNHLWEIRLELFDRRQLDDFQ